MNTMTFKRDIQRGGTIYRYDVTSYWNKDKRGPRQKVKYLGKVTYDENGREVLVKKSFMVDSIEKSTPVGDIAVYFSIAKELRLMELINECCPKVGYPPGVPIIILAINQLTGRRPLHKLTEWVLNTPLSEWMNVDVQLTKDIFLSSLDSLCRLENGDIVHYGWAAQKESVKKWSSLYGSGNGRLYYDVTRIRYYGICCPLAERGRNSKNGKKEIGVAMVIAQKSGFPVACRPIPGARGDSITFRDIITSLSNWGLRKTTIIVDRGMANGQNLKYALEKRYNLIMCCSETSIEVLKEMGRWSDDDIMKPENIYERGEKQYIYLKGWSGRLFGCDGKFVVALDPIKQAEERTFRDWIEKQLKSPNLTEKQKRKLENYLKKGYYEDHGLIQPEDSMCAMYRDDAARRRCGRYLFFSTNERYSNEEIFRWYYQKDEIEKVFRTLNNELGIIPIKYSNPFRIEAYLTVNFFAYLLWAVIRYKLQKAKEKMSVSEVIEELQKIVQIQYLSKGKRKKALLQPTLLQWDLMKLFKIDSLLQET